MLKLYNQGNTCYINSILQVLNNLNIKHDYVYKPNNRFKRNEQNDQHDFILFLLDYINETTAVKFKTPQIDQNIDPLKKKGLLNLYNIGLAINNVDKGHIYISKIFDFIGQKITQIKCMNCKKIKKNFEVFKILEINIPSNNDNPTIYDCIEFTFAPSILNEYTCSKCKKIGDAIQVITLWRLPKILSIMFVRNIYTNGKNIKNDKIITFENDLYLNKYYAFKTDNIIEYNLNSIAYHHGRAEFGHCTAVCKHNNKWFNCNDDAISIIDKPENKNAYILFYILNNNS